MSPDCRLPGGVRRALQGLAILTLGCVTAQAGQGGPSGPPPPQGSLAHLHSWLAVPPDVPAQTSGRSHYVGMMAADGLTTELDYALGIPEINPMVRAMPGTAGRAAYFALSAVVMGKIDDRLARAHRLLPLLLRAYIGGRQKQYISDNITLQSWARGGVLTHTPAPSDLTATVGAQ